jgi:catechol 2,3-dioxygenase-like lactoylglutathione lyase family enzyme
MKILAIDHVQLAMPPGGEDLARSFYIDVLGLTEVPKPPNLASRGGVWFTANGVNIHLGVEDPFSPARKAHPAILVSDLEALIKMFKEAGVVITEDQPLEGYHRIYASDPFGNRMEFMQRL